MKRISVIIAIAGMLAVAMLAGCQKQEAAAPAAQSVAEAATAPTSTPTATVPAEAPAK